MITSDIHDYLRPGRRVTWWGLAVCPCPLAEVLHGAGMCISGSDMRESATVEHLRSLGITVAIGHRAENVAGAELVIRTAAVHDSNPEIAEARRLGIPVFERAQRGAPSCGATAMPCASPAPMERPPRLPCAPISPWPPKPTPPS